MNYAVCFQPGLPVKPPFVGVIVEDRGTRLVLEVKGEEISVFKPACSLFKRKADAERFAGTNGGAKAKRSKRRRT